MFDSYRTSDIDKDFINELFEQLFNKLSEMENYDTNLIRFVNELLNSLCEETKERVYDTKILDFIDLFIQHAMKSTDSFKNVYPIIIFLCMKHHRSNLINEIINKVSDKLPNGINDIKEYTYYIVFVIETVMKTKHIDYAKDYKEINEIIQIYLNEECSYGLELGKNYVDNDSLKYLLEQMDITDIKKIKSLISALKNVQVPSHSCSFESAIECFHIDSESGGE